jgi:hypothetical protein
VWRSHLFVEWQDIPSPKLKCFQIVACDPFRVKTGDDRVASRMGRNGYGSAR